MEKKLDYYKIKKFYEKSSEVWPSGNIWYDYEKKKIKYFINKYIFDGYILNAGSGGNTYGLTNKMCHVDIVETNICKYDDYVVANIEQLPFQNLVFDYIICVGDVINYCDAEKAIKELHRVVKKQGKMIIEFENASAYEYIGRKFYGSDKVLTNLEYMGEVTNQYLYSCKYIKEILEMNGFEIKKELSMHIISGLASNWISNDNISCLFVALDFIFSKLRYFRNHGSNILLLCEKTNDF